MIVSRVDVDFATAQFPRDDFSTAGELHCLKRGSEKHDDTGSSCCHEEKIRLPPGSVQRSGSGECLNREAEAVDRRDDAGEGKNEVEHEDVTLLSRLLLVFEEIHRAAAPLSCGVVSEGRIRILLQHCRARFHQPLQTWSQGRS